MKQASAQKTDTWNGYITRTSLSTPPAEPSIPRLSNTPYMYDGINWNSTRIHTWLKASTLTQANHLGKQPVNVPIADGNMPDPYDSFHSNVPDATTGVLYVWALGGDVWALNITNGAIFWSGAPINFTDQQAPIPIWNLPNLGLLR